MTDLLLEYSLVQSFRIRNSCHAHLPNSFETPGEGSSCLIAMRSAIARAVSSGSGLENSVEIKVFPKCLFSIESSSGELTTSMVKSKVAPLHRIGCFTSVSATFEGTVKSALDLLSDRFSTKYGTTLLPAFGSVRVLLLILNFR